MILPSDALHSSSPPRPTASRLEGRPLPDSRAASEEVLVGLVGRNGILGAALVGRDGIPVMHRFGRSCNVEAVCAMGAAVLGASDAALADVVGEDALRFSAEGRTHRFLGLGVDEEMLLLVVAESKTALEEAFGLMETAVRSLQGILREA